MLFQSTNKLKEKCLPDSTFRLVPVGILSFLLPLDDHVSASRVSLHLLAVAATQKTKRIQHFLCSTKEMVGFKVVIWVLICCM